MRQWFYMYRNLRIIVSWVSLLITVSPPWQVFSYRVFLTRKFFWVITLLYVNAQHKHTHVEIVQVPRYLVLQHWRRREKQRKSETTGMRRELDKTVQYGHQSLTISFMRTFRAVSQEPSTCFSRVFYYSSYNGTK